MNPHTRLSWTLILSLVIWAPIALSVLDDQIDFWTGGLYFVAAIAFSYFGTGIIQYLTNNYRETQDSLLRAKQQIEYIERRAATDNETPARRATDAEDNY